MFEHLAELQRINDEIIAPFKHIQALLVPDQMQPLLEIHEKLVPPDVLMSVIAPSASTEVC